MQESQLQTNNNTYLKSVPLSIRENNTNKESLILAKKISAELGIHPTTAHILVQRGVSSINEAKAFLKPTLREHLPDPSKLKSAELAVKIITNAIENNKYITLFSDFDVDGITSASQMWLVLEPAGAKVRHYVPDRKTEGYGLSADAIKKLADEKTQLLITLDCGISNAKEIELAKNLGLEVIVIDHHEVPPEIPKADCIVNPMQNDCSFKSHKLATAGIVWLISILLIKELKLIQNKEIKNLPNTKDLLDLAAIGTICDMVPLTGLNRLIASRGLDAIRTSPRSGIKSLIEVAQLPIGERFSCSSISFGIGPRLNAAGRLEDASLGFKLLTSPPSQFAKDTAMYLQKLNLERRKLEDETKEICLKLINEESELNKQFAYALYHDSFHPGVIGIAAQRLVEKMHRPVAVMAPGEVTFNGNTLKVIKGSVRSIPEFNVVKGLAELSSILYNYGGHAEAGGFSLLPENLTKFQESFNQVAKQILENIEIKKLIRIDLELSFSDISIRLVQEINSLAPFGVANPSPVFITKGVEIEHLQLIGDSHVKLELKENGTVRNGIGWRMRGHPLLIKNKKVDLVYSLEINTYKGVSSVQLILKEILSTNSDSL